MPISLLYTMAVGEKKMMSCILPNAGPADRTQQSMAQSVDSAECVEECLACVESGKPVRLPALIGVGHGSSYVRVDFRQDCADPD